MAELLADFGPILMFAGFGGGGGAFSAKLQQEQIKSTVCDLVAQIDAYKTMAAQQVDVFNMAESAAQADLDNLNDSITQLQQLTRLSMQSFKTKYNTFVVVSGLFLMGLIFIFAAKRFILHAHTVTGT